MSEHVVDSRSRQKQGESHREQRLSRRSLLKLTGTAAVAGLGTGVGAGQRPLRTLMVTANRPVYYDLTVSDYLEADTLGGNFSGEDDDTPTEVADGELEVSDGTGPAPRNASATAFFGDRYLFTGTITEFVVSSAPSDDVYIYLDEVDVARGDVVGATAIGTPRTLMLAANAPTDYSLGVDGTLEPDTLGGYFVSDDGDTVTQTTSGTYTVSDGTGPDPSNASATTYLGDRFLFRGDIETLDTSLPSGGDLNLYLDEELVTRSALPGLR